MRVSIALFAFAAAFSTNVEATTGAEGRCVHELTHESCKGKSTGFECRLSDIAWVGVCVGQEIAGEIMCRCEEADMFGDSQTETESLDIAVGKNYGEIVDALLEHRNSAHKVTKQSELSHSATGVEGKCVHEFTHMGCKGKSTGFECRMSDMPVVGVCVGQEIAGEILCRCEEVDMHDNDMETEIKHEVVAETAEAGEWYADRVTEFLKTESKLSHSTTGAEGKCVHEFTHPGCKGKSTGFECRMSDMPVVGVCVGQEIAGEIMCRCEEVDMLGVQKQEDWHADRVAQFLQQ